MPGRLEEVVHGPPGAARISRAGHAVRWRGSAARRRLPRAAPHRGHFAFSVRTRSRDVRSIASFVKARSSRLVSSADVLRSSWTEAAGFVAAAPFAAEVV